MRTRRRATSRDLRLAVDCLPRQTRLAMLEGIAGNEIIAGAYATGDGICPMLAAHRSGGRTNVIAFAHAWDRFAFRDARSQSSRRATGRELRVLKVYLEASLLEEDAPALGTGLAAARREHAALVRVRQRAEPEPPAAPLGDPDRPAEPDRPPDLDRPGDPDRQAELGGRPGWAWSRLMRRYDEYARLLDSLEREAVRSYAASERAARTAHAR